MNSFARHAVIKIGGRLGFCCRSSRTKFLPLSTIIIIASLSSVPARADIGFTGSFDPSGWALVNKTDGTTDQTLGYPGLECNSALGIPGNTNSVACAEAITSDSFDLVSSRAGEPGGLTSADNPRTTTLTIAPGVGKKYFVSFKFFFSSAETESGTLEAYYQIGTNGPVRIATWDGGPDPISNIYTDLPVLTGQSVSFIVKTNNNTSPEGVLTIYDFTYDVPAPLPAAGAATAFGYSRRLRRRIKGKVPSKHKQSRTPSYPGAYLNLPPLALQAIPLTFNYQARSEGRFSMVASASSSSRFASH